MMENVYALFQSVSASLDSEDKGVLKLSAEQSDKVVGEIK